MSISICGTQCWYSMFWTALSQVRINDFSILEFHKIEIYNQFSLSILKFFSLEFSFQTLVILVLFSFPLLFFVVLCSPMAVPDYLFKTLDLECCTRHSTSLNHRHSTRSQSFLAMHLHSY
jgi:hypothetical protein